MAHAVSLIPLVTEKSLRLAGEGKYTFATNRTATKLGVQRAVEAAYDVHVVAVNVSKSAAKVKARGTRPGFSKAVVTLRKGETIKGFELPIEAEHNHDHADDKAENKTDAKAAVKKGK